MYYFAIEALMLDINKPLGEQVKHYIVKSKVRHNTIGKAIAADFARQFDLGYGLVGGNWYEIDPGKIAVLSYESQYLGDRVVQIHNCQIAYYFENNKLTRKE